MRYLYSALLYALFPLVLLRMLWRSRQAPAYRRRLGERFGLFPAEFDKAMPAIWVHAVSVGEVLAATPLIEQLLQDYPGYRLLVTTTTPTGSQQVLDNFAGRVFHVYAPWDLPGSVHRFLARTQPGLLLLLETELWPNLLHGCRQAGCKVLLANGRLSEKSARGYARLGALSRGLFAGLDKVACQSRTDGDRFLALGLPPEALCVTGNLKFDIEVGADERALAAQLRSQLNPGNRPVLVAGSTHAGEEEHLLAACAELRATGADCLLILVPRHPERFDRVYTLCVEQDSRVVRRSETDSGMPETDIVLWDSVGNLSLLYGVATMAYIGGSLVDRGGHNALEAAVWGVPVVSGPSMFNFEAVNTLLIEAGAMVKLTGPQQLGRCLQELLDDPPHRVAMGKAGQQVVAANRGTRKRLLELLGETMKGR
jgi:3-deoxy-D-manno-octulosonic-acid transferase